MLCKPDFVARAMALRGDATHFAWIDFNIAHTLGDAAKALGVLKGPSAAAGVCCVLCHITGSCFTNASNARIVDFLSQATVATDHPIEGHPNALNPSPSEPPPPRAASGVACRLQKRRRPRRLLILILGETYLAFCLLLVARSETRRRRDRRGGAAATITPRRHHQSKLCPIKIRPTLRPVALPYRRPDHMLGQCQSPGCGLCAAGFGKARRGAPRFCCWFVAQKR